MGAGAASGAEVLGAAADLGWPPPAVSPTVTMATQTATSAAATAAVLRLGITLVLLLNLEGWFARFLSPLPVGPDRRPGQQLVRLGEPFDAGLQLFGFPLDNQVKKGPQIV
jgi:hypothetical protein